MTQKVFLDTNIWIYAHDSRDLTKQAVARELLLRIAASSEGCISTQVVQEFCNVVLVKIKSIKAAHLLATVHDIFEQFSTHTPSMDFYERALVLHERYKMSFYDALIVQAALDLDCSLLYSEDLQAGQKFGQLTVVNPFK